MQLQSSLIELLPLTVSAFPQVILFQFFLIVTLIKSMFLEKLLAVDEVHFGFIHPKHTEKDKFVNESLECIYFFDHHVYTIIYFLTEIKYLLGVL